MIEDSFCVPSVVIPSLIGLKGNKHKDTEQISKTKISFKRMDSCTHKVHISGLPEGIKTAKKIVELAVKHYSASVAIGTVLDNNVAAKEEAILDCKMFISEVMRMKCK